jgi:hypothetical protein
MARYQLIHALNQLYKGVQRFAFYELRDEYPGARTSASGGANGGRRLAADAMRNLLTVLGDARTGPPRQPTAPPIGAGTRRQPLHGALEPVIHRGQEHIAAPERAAAGIRRATNELHHRRKPRRLHLARRLTRRRPPSGDHPPLKG